MWWRVVFFPIHLNPTHPAQPHQTPPSLTQLQPTKVHPTLPQPNPTPPHCHPTPIHPPTPLPTLSRPTLPCSFPSFAHQVGNFLALEMGGVCRPRPIMKMNEGAIVAAPKLQGVAYELPLRPHLHFKLRVYKTADDPICPDIPPKAGTQAPPITPGGRL